MTTMQAVWPEELTTRRNAHRELTIAMHMLRRVPEVRLSEYERAELTRLRDELAALPCPHWDLTPPPLDSSIWTCESCGAGIAPKWVALSEQERELRRISRRVDI